MKRTFLFISLIVQTIFCLVCLVLLYLFLPSDVEPNTALRYSLFISCTYTSGPIYCLFPFGRKPKPYELPLNLSIIALIFIVNSFLFAHYECFALTAVYGIFALFDIWAAYKTHKNGVVKNA